MGSEMCIRDREKAKAKESEDCQLLDLQHMSMDCKMISMKTFSLVKASLKDAVKAKDQTVDSKGHLGKVLGESSIQGTNKATL